MTTNIVLKFSLDGKTAVISGAGRGLGLAFAEALASSKCNIAGLDILPNPSPSLFDLRAKANVKVEYYQTDVTSRSQVQDVISRIQFEFGRIDININAAGVATDESFLSTSEQTVQKTFDVNFTGSFLVAQACARSMVDRYKSHFGNTPAKSATTGCIIFIGSIATYIASSSQRISCYTASKAAVKGLVRPLAMELAPYGIRVNSLSPGYMMTDMMKDLQSQQPDLVSQFEKETLFGQIGSPDELKGPVLWLCADTASGWYTGQDLLVDGGAHIWKHPAVLD